MSRLFNDVCGSFIYQLPALAIRFKMEINSQSTTNTDFEGDRENSLTADLIKNIGGFSQPYLLHLQYINCAIQECF